MPLAGDRPPAFARLSPGHAASAAARRVARTGVARSAEPLLEQVLCSAACRTFRARNRNGGRGAAVRVREAAAASLRLAVRDTRYPLLQRGVSAERLPPLPPAPNLIPDSASSAPLAP